MVTAAKGAAHACIVSIVLSSGGGVAQGACAALAKATKQ